MLAAAARRPLKVGDKQTGAASWYGARYHGRTTSSGERFDKDGLTAAHLSLPFGTRVRVRNLDNDSAVIVRITDRGPFGRGRVLDVSEGAAEALGFRNRGVCRVAVEVLPALVPDAVPVQQTLPCFEETEFAHLAPIALTFPEPDRYYFLALNSYPELASAEIAVQELQAQNPGLPVVVADETDGGQVVHRILAGRFQDRFEAKLLSDRLRRHGLQASVQEIDLAAN